MDILDGFFSSSPAQRSVAERLLEHGMRVVDGRALCGDVEVGETAISRAFRVDRRVVKTTLERISSDPELASVFSEAEPMLNMERIAKHIGCTSITIAPTDPEMPGILADVMVALSRENVSIRQAVVKDSGDRSRSVLVVVVDGELPPDLLPVLRSCRGVRSITLN